LGVAFDSTPDVAVAAEVGECSTEAADRAAAAAMAIECGTPVEAVSERTPWETVLVNPDGTVRWEATSEAHRAEVAGEWLPIDTSIDAVPTDDGELAPRAAALPMAFSNGGGRAASTHIVW